MEQRSKPVSLGRVGTQPQPKHQEEFENNDLTFAKDDSTKEAPINPPRYQQQYPASYTVPKPTQPQSALPPWNYVREDSYARPRSSLEDLRAASERQWYMTTRRKALEQAENNRQGGVWNFIKRQRVKTCIIFFVSLLVILVLVLIAAHGMRGIDGDHEKAGEISTAIEGH